MVLDLLSKVLSGLVDNLFGETDILLHFIYGTAADSIVLAICKPGSNKQFITIKHFFCNLDHLFLELIACGKLLPDIFRIL